MYMQWRVDQVWDIPVSLSCGCALDRHLFLQIGVCCRPWWWYGMYLNAGGARSPGDKLNNIRNHTDASNALMDMHNIGNETGMVENTTRNVGMCRVELQMQNSLIVLKIEPSELTGRWKRAGIGEASAYALVNMPLESPGECGLNICIWTSEEWRQGVGRKWTSCGEQWDGWEWQWQSTRWQWWQRQHNEWWYCRLSMDQGNMASVRSL